MKKLIIALALINFSPVALSMGSRAPVETISKKDRELLEFSRAMLPKYLDRRIWQVGLEQYEVEGPAQFVEQKVGLYYTGRLKVKRWGVNMDQELSDYAWDADAGERWHVLREVVYYDHEQMSYSLGYQGPNPASDWHQAEEYTEELVGIEPDWSEFK